MARPVQLLLLCLGCAPALRVGGWTRREMTGAASLAIGLTALRPPALAQEILLLTDEELREFYYQLQELIRAFAASHP